jgi:ATP-dependent Clp protease adaptor protein ClpS
MIKYEEKHREDEVEFLSGVINRSTLMLHNDDFHTFDFVVDALVDICDHDPNQAEQCAYITHYKGKCDVKKGKMSVIKPMRDGLAEKGLKVTII